MGGEGEAGRWGDGGGGVVLEGGGEGMTKVMSSKRKGGMQRGVFGCLGKGWGWVTVEDSWKRERGRREEGVEGREAEGRGGGV